MRGSCWAFGSTATLESQWALATNGCGTSARSSSSCVFQRVGNDSMGGCNGMFPSHAFDYMLGSKGLRNRSFTHTSATSLGTGQTTTRVRNAITDSGHPYRNDAGGGRESPRGQRAVTAVVYVPNSLLRYERGIFREPSCESNSMSPSTETP